MISLENNNLDALLGLAISLEGLSRIEGALKYFDMVLDQDPCNKQALLRKAAIYGANGPVEDALKIYDMFRSLGDMPGKLLIEEAKILPSLFFYGKAKARLLELIAIEPDNNHALLMMKEIEE